MERSLAIDMAYVGVAEPGDGVAGTAYDQFKEIESVTFNFSEPKEISFKVMGREDPWAVVNKKGDPSSVEFAIPSPTAEEMKTFCGGTVTNNKWEAPASTPSIIKSVKMQTSPYEGKYTEYIIPKAAISGRISQAPGEEQTDLLLVKATIMTPVSAAGAQEAPFSREVKPVDTPTPPAE